MRASFRLSVVERELLALLDPVTNNRQQQATMAHNIGSTTDLSVIPPDELLATIDTMLDFEQDINFLLIPTRTLSDEPEAIPRLATYLEVTMSLTGFGLTGPVDDPRDGAVVDHLLRAATANEDLNLDRFNYMSCPAATPGVFRSFAVAKLQYAELRIPFYSRNHQAALHVALSHDVSVDLLALELGVDDDAHVLIDVIGSVHMDSVRILVLETRAGAAFVNISPFIRALPFTIQKLSLGCVVIDASVQHLSVNSTVQDLYLDSCILPDCVLPFGGLELLYIFEGQYPNAGHVGQLLLNNRLQLRNLSLLAVPEMLYNALLPLLREVKVSRLELSDWDHVSRNVVCRLCDVLSQTELKRLNMTAPSIEQSSLDLLLETVGNGRALSEFVLTTSHPSPVGLIEQVTPLVRANEFAPVMKLLDMDGGDYSSPELDFFNRLSRRGRRCLLRPPQPESVPDGLWANILARNADGDDHCGYLFYFLRRKMDLVSASLQRRGMVRPRGDE